MVQSGMKIKHWSDMNDISRKNQNKSGLFLEMTRLSVLKVREHQRGDLRPEGAVLRVSYLLELDIIDTHKFPETAN